MREPEAAVKIRDMMELEGRRAGASRGCAGVIASITIPGGRGTVTIAGKPGKDLSQDMISSILKQAGLSGKDLP